MPGNGYVNGSEDVDSEGRMTEFQDVEKETSLVLETMKLDIEWAVVSNVVDIEWAVVSNVAKAIKKGCTRYQVSWKDWS